LLPQEVGVRVVALVPEIPMVAMVVTAELVAAA